jgi:hypothetical protein
MDSFWVKVQKADGCWPYMGYLNRRGYGKHHVSNRGSIQSHRLAWELTNGPIPPGLMVCHHCDNPPCCNPAHLFLGTAADNVGDMVRKGRARGGNQRGEQVGNHRLTDEQVRQLRALRANGYSFSSIAILLHVAATTVVRAARGTRWAHVHGGIDKTCLSPAKGRSVVPFKTRNCLFCGAPHSRHPKAKYCSRVCNNQAHGSRRALAAHRDAKPGKEGG